MLKMNWYTVVISGLLLHAQVNAQSMNCNFAEYKALDGLKAEMSAGSVVFTRQGEGDGKMTGRQIISAWDSAGSGAFTQPVHF
jgi:hypothetical protein